MNEYENAMPDAMRTANSKIVLLLGNEQLACASEQFKRLAMYALNLMVDM
jgi:hypothetical protein